MQHVQIYKAHKAGQSIYYRDREHKIVDIQSSGLCFFDDFGYRIPLDSLSDIELENVFIVGKLNS